MESNGYKIGILSHLSDMKFEKTAKSLDIG